VSGGRAVARAIDALRRGWPVRSTAMTASSRSRPPTTTLAAFDAGRPGGPPHLGQPRGDPEARQPARGHPDRAGADRPHRPGIDLAEATAIADPALDLAIR
jgi:GTP cyclohydrolase II